MPEVSHGHQPLRCSPGRSQARRPSLGSSPGLTDCNRHSNIVAHATSRVLQMTLPRGSYRPRVVDDELASLLSAASAVLVEGPRACGKTATTTRASRSHVNLEREVDSRAAGRVDPRVLLPGEQPRLIDEWQLVPEVWGQVRAAVDESGGRAGQFILTGSAVPPDDPVRHSGAGRFLRLRMRPMSLAEMGRSSRDLSLRSLMDGARVQAPRSTSRSLMWPSWSAAGAGQPCSTVPWRRLSGPCGAISTMPPRRTCAARTASSETLGASAGSSGRWLDARGRTRVLGPSPPT